MKQIIILLIIVFSSCSKSEVKTKCYICQVGSGMVVEVKEVCTNRIDTVKFKDNMGNELQSFCNEKP